MLVAMKAWHIIFGWAVLGCGGDGPGDAGADGDVGEVADVAEIGDGETGDDAADTTDATETLGPDGDDGGGNDGDGDDGDDGDGGTEVYGPVTLAGEVPPALERAVWVSHYQSDVLPFWSTDVALGTPVGNFPTFRGMDGAMRPPTRRRPRMIARQVYGYVAGYLMTGDDRLLGWAHAGVSWLREHAIDRARGGCYPELEADGRPVEGVRTAQDQAYCMLALAAWVFLTRDPDAEADLLAGRDLLMDPDRFWDAANGRIRDALDATLTNEVDVESDGGWELVAQLDPVNAFMMLAQPVLSDPADRDQWLADMRTLMDLMTTRFASNGFVWGVSQAALGAGQYRSKHADFGHSMKTVWMALQLDKRLADHPYHDWVMALGPALVARAFDADNGRWAKRPTSATTVEYGSDWWIYAEADQLAATLNLRDGAFDDELAQTAGHWIDDYVDREYARELIPSVDRQGHPVYDWPVTDTAKCNEWKNAFHSSEHALVLSILGRQREGAELPLHFAVPDEAAESFIARPYIFLGREIRREPGDPLTVGGRALRQVVVTFRDIY